MYGTFDNHCNNESFRDFRGCPSLVSVLDSRVCMKASPTIAPKANSGETVFAPARPRREGAASPSLSLTLQGSGFRSCNSWPETEAACGLQFRFLEAVV